MIGLRPAVTVSRPVRLGYGIGSFCTGAFSTVPGLLLLYYLTNVLAVPAWIAGLVVFLPKLWDMIIHPWVGRCSDRTCSRLGARRPWLLAGALTLPVTFALTFAGPPLTGIPAALYVGTMFLLATTAFACFQVPYVTMPTEMTDDYHERSSLLQWRMGFLGLAILVSGAVAPILTRIENAAGSVAGYRLMGLATALLLFAAMLGAFLGTARAPVVHRAGAEPSLWAQFAAVRTSGTFRLLLAVGCSQMFGAGVVLAAAPYVATYLLDDPAATTTLFLCLVGPMPVTMPLWVRLSRKLDKRGAMVVSAALFGAGALGMNLTPWFGPRYAHLCVVVIGLGYAGLQLMQFSMLADVVAHDVATTGRRRAGVLAGVWTACETVVFAFGALVLSWMLGLTGFVASDGSAAVRQPEAALLAARFGGTTLAAVFMAVSVVPTLRYPLTAATLERAGRAAAPGER